MTARYNWRVVYTDPEGGLFTKEVTVEGRDILEAIPNAIRALVRLDAGVADIVKVERLEEVR